MSKGKPREGVYSEHEGAYWIHGHLSQEEAQAEVDGYNCGPGVTLGEVHHDRIRISPCRGCHWGCDCSPERPGWHIHGGQKAGPGAFPVTVGEREDGR